MKIQSFFKGVLYLMLIETAFAVEFQGHLSDKVNPGKTSLVEAAPVLKPKLRWQMDLPPILSHQALQPAVTKDGKILYLSAGGFLIKADAEKGNILWKENIKAIGFTTIFENTLYIAGAKYLTAYDISGKTPVKKWEFVTAQAFISDSKYCAEGGGLVTPLKDLVLFGYGRIGAKETGDIKVRAINSVTGKELWSFDPKQMVSPAVAVDEKAGLCFFITAGEQEMPAAKEGEELKKNKGKVIPKLIPSGYLCAVELSTGKEKWRAVIGNYGTPSGPAVSDGVVYAGGLEDLFAFNTADGKELWKVKRKNRKGGWKAYRSNNICITADRIVVNTTQDVEAHLRKDGSLLWEQKMSSDSYFMIADKDILYLPMYNKKGEINAISLNDGKMLWSHPIADGSGQCKGVGVGEGIIIFGTYAGKLYCLENDK
jgi:outer membrane protein assembly factor BamB